MKHVIAVVLCVVTVFLLVSTAFAALPPWYRKEGDRILHAEGRDPNNPRLAYTAGGGAYALDKLWFDVEFDDSYEASRAHAREIMARVKTLPGVKDVRCRTFQMPEEGIAYYWENHTSIYSIKVELEYPYDSYYDVFNTLKNDPEVYYINHKIIPGDGEEVRLFYGDVDYNGAVTAADARQILRYSVSLDTPEEYHISFGDLNGDGVLTAADARTCLRTAVGLDAKRVYDGD